LTALIAFVEVEGECEPTVRSRGAEVVAVGSEEPAVGHLVASDLEALEAARPVGERLRQLGHDPTTDRDGQLAAALRIPHDTVAAALQLRAWMLISRGRRSSQTSSATSAATRAPSANGSVARTRRLGSSRNAVGAPPVR
jgi:hypothetical protein